MTQPTTTATPVEIDTTLAALYTAEAKVEARLAGSIGDLHYAIGERPTRVVHSTGRKTWPTTDEQAIDTARARVTTGTGTAWDLDRLTRGLAKYDTARTELAEIGAAMAPLHAEYRNRPWTRFHPVPGGHIHRDHACHTLRITTDVRWLPEMSGQDEATALNTLGEAGHLLCTVCFPNAPTQYTVAAPRKTREEVAADKAAAAAQARVTDPTLIAAVDGGELRVDRTPLRTVRAAEIAAVDHLFWAAYGRHVGEPNETYAAGHEGHAREIVAALAHKAGTTEAAELARLTAKAVKKVRRDLGAEVATAAAAVWAG